MFGWHKLSRETYTFGLKFCTLDFSFFTLFRANYRSLKLYSQIVKLGHDFHENWLYRVAHNTDDSSALIGDPGKTNHLLSCVNYPLPARSPVHTGTMARFLFPPLHCAAGRCAVNSRRVYARAALSPVRRSVRRKEVVLVRKQSIGV